MSSSVSVRAAAPITSTLRPMANVVAAVVGNALEFYDFIVYALFAVFIGRAFFPTDSAYGSLLLSVATFGVGFVTRPLGAMLIGAYADRAGRKPAMTLTIVLMAIGSGAIAILPTYATIGVAAPVLLVVARMIQGFSTGGEMGPATTFLIEASPDGRRGFYSSFQGASQAMATIGGALVGVGLSQVLSPEQLGAWGWRVPFAVGLLILPVGLYIRSQLEETLDTTTAHQTTGAVLGDVAGSHKLTVLLATLTIFGGTVTQYFFGYTATYAISTLHMTVSIAMLSTLVGGVVGFVFAVVGGMLADRFGPIPTQVFGRGVVLLTIYPVLVMIDQHRDAGVLLGLIGFLAVFHSIGSSGGMLLMPECFPTLIRTTGLSISYALGVTIFGGTAQIIFVWLIKTTGNPVSPVWWLIVANIVTIVATLALAPAHRRFHNH